MKDKKILNYYPSGATFRTEKIGFRNFVFKGILFPLSVTAAFFSVVWLLVILLK